MPVAFITHFKQSVLTTELAKFCHESQALLETHGVHNGMLHNQECHTLGTVSMQDTSAPSRPKHETLATTRGPGRDGPSNTNSCVHLVLLTEMASP